MPTSNTEELGRFLKCTVIGRGVFGPCACCIWLLCCVITLWITISHRGFQNGYRLQYLQDFYISNIEIL